MRKNKSEKGMVISRFKNSFLELTIELDKIYQEAKASVEIDGETKCLDENGSLVNPLQGDKLEEWRNHPMNAPLRKEWR